MSASSPDGRPAERPARVYADHAASAPVLPEAAEAVLRALSLTGNASSAHAEGRAARRVLEESRERVAASLGAAADEVVLTSGGTEADALAVTGLYRARREQDPARRRVLVSAVEHPAVLEPARGLAAAEGAELVLLPVDERGRLRTDALAAELERHGGATALVSTMWANNETGVLQPLEEVVRLAAAHGVPVHSDAVQAPATQDVDLAASGLAALSVSGHKVGAPVGTGALLLRRGQALAPLVRGGGQERGLRSGTSAVALAAGLATALAAAARDRPAEAARLAGLRARLLAGVRAGVPDAALRGDERPGASLPGTAMLTLPGCDGDALLYLLDARDVAVSTGSACSAGALRPSHVLAAMGVPDDDARGALRVSLGRTSTAEDVDRLVAVLPEVVVAARRARAATLPTTRTPSPTPAAAGSAATAGV
ncbi:cysteine desulfurase family protein [uncultured Pseudokineococcus sp.]|uniref:cysteine desulfurase family protein n=1 Tax=uncultured Pseudokineococcus sp. TaxID=1642928 RepID=UPI0026096EAC|nr:cysteine desulfurase family protein [uncultured Pseudokineococcus sp.]